MVCQGCSISEETLIRACCASDKEALRILEEHGVIPVKRTCGRCGRELKLDPDRSEFRCHKRFKRQPRCKAVVRCNFYASRFKDTWLENTKLSPKKILLFINAFLRKSFSQDYFTRNYNLSSATIVEWKSFCSEVCESWVLNQKPIGGPGKVVEVVVNPVTKGKNNNTRDVGGVCVFGGIERGTNRCFLVPLKHGDPDTLPALCQEYILPSTTVYSPAQPAFEGLSKLGYQHKFVSQSEGGVCPVDDVHINSISSLWDDMKSWVFRAGTRKVSYRQYLARYLFCRSHPDHSTILHHFLCEVALHNPPPQ